MSQSNKSSHNDLLSGAINALTDNPRNFLIFVVIVGGAIFSVRSILLGLLILAAIIPFSKLWKWALAGGVIFLVLSWLVGDVSIQMVHQQNQGILMGLFHGRFTLLENIYPLLCAFPYGLLIGGLLGGFLKLNIGLHDQVKRVARGESQKKDPFIRHRRVQRALDHLPSSAYSSGTVLGVDRKTGNYAVLEDKDANLHTLAIGTTGSGKTTSLGNIVESVILRELPLFFIDGKGDLELANRIAQFAKTKNRPFYLFSMVGPSIKYNPIAFGGYTSKKDRLIELRNWSEDHYRKIAEGYLQTVFKVLGECNISLDLRSLVSYLQPKKLQILASSLKKTALSEEVESLKPKYEEVSSLVAEIENLVNSEIGHLFDCSSGEVLTLDRALQEQAVVYFCLQPLAFPAYAELLGKLIINDLKSLIATQLQKTEKLKIYTIFDDFSVFAGDQIMNLMNQGRGAGVHAIVSTQSLSDLLRKGGEALLGQLLNNINNYIIQRQNNPADAEILANIIGTKDDFQITSKVSVDPGSPNSGSIRLVKEFIIHPDQIKRLELGEAILVNKQNFRVQRAMLRKGNI